MPASGARFTIIQRILTCGSTGQPIQLIKQIAKSGEAEIWRTNRVGALAKVYHQPSPERAQKLACMIRQTPADPNASLNHHSLAWPEATLIDQRNQVVGFLMPEIGNGKELLKICNPRSRKRLQLQVSWYFLHVAARNIAVIVQTIHKKGYVLGDIKLQNILINDQALPSIIDTDSFQVTDETTGQIYRCQVASEGFTPAELLGKTIPDTDQAEVHDRFRLGVVIYHLLFGTHPFQGKWQGPGDAPAPSELIRQGYWPYGAKSLIQPSQLTIPLDIVSTGIQDHFRRCFNEGHHTPLARPTAQEWADVLSASLPLLQRCQQQPRHFYNAYNATLSLNQKSGKLPEQLRNLPPSPLPPSSSSSALSSGLSSALPGSSTLPANPTNPCYWCNRAQQFNQDVFDDQLQKKSKHTLRKSIATKATVNPSATPLPGSPVPPSPRYVSPPPKPPRPVLCQSKGVTITAGLLGTWVSGVICLYLSNVVFAGGDSMNTDILLKLFIGVLMGGFVAPFAYFASVYWWLSWSHSALAEFLFKLTFLSGVIGGVCGSVFNPNETTLGTGFAVLIGAGLGVYQAMDLPRR
jgi:serine/threonine protein kinase